MNRDFKKIVHLINRATFGFSAEDLIAFKSVSLKKAVDLLFKNSEEYVAISAIKPNSFGFIDLPIADREARIKKRQKATRARMKLNCNWLNLITLSNAQLREKMAFFWHDHFACGVRNPIKMQKYINTLRKNALGYFGDLVVEISKDPAMIEYLNGELNTKNRPNENFAREVLELFTIGIGNYSEQDIQEAARAFTGYSYDGKGNFYIYEDLHDNGEKVFLNRSGNFKGDDILNIVFENKNTGDYIISKIFKFFLGKEIPISILEELRSGFYASGYHIGKLLQKMFLADWFYDAAYSGNKIKSPIELICGTMRLVNAKHYNTKAAILLQKKMDQVLMSPPNVSGWTDGKNWIHLSTLTERLNVAKILLSNRIQRRIRNAAISNEGGETFFKKSINIKHKIKLKPLKDAVTDFNTFVNLLYSFNTEHINSWICAVENDYENKQKNFAAALILLLSQPEYQVH